MENQSITHLLSHISVICRKYEEIAEITGENFNIFKVLGLTTNEVRTHSAFLAELLNPKGSHGCKDAFLKLFVEELNIIGFNTENAITQVEKHIGFINDDYTEGGYIDIIISNKNNQAIIIENKIYAEDQEKQILRYHNYGNKYHCQKFNLLYLTLNGTEPANFSTHTLEKETHFQCISYSNNIVNWLEKCQKEAVNKPILRETITQYIHLLKHLTNQSINNKMSEEIVKQILKDESNFDAYAKLFSSYKAMYTEVIQKHSSLSIANVLKNKNIITNFEDRLYNGLIKNERYWSFFITTDNLKKLNLKVLFQFQDKDFKDFTFGYAYYDKAKKNEMPNETLNKHKLILNNFKEKFGEIKTSDGFLCYQKYKKFTNWLRFETLKLMYFNLESGKTEFEKDFEEKVDFLIAVYLDKNNI